MNNIEIESGDFRFRTPRVPKNPIEKVYVLYSSETTDIRLQWTLESYFFLN